MNHRIGNTTRNALWGHAVLMASLMVGCQATPPLPAPSPTPEVALQTPEPAQTPPPVPRATMYEISLSSSAPCLGEPQSARLSFIKGTPLVGKVTYWLDDPVTSNADPLGSDAVKLGEAGVEDTLTFTLTGQMGPTRRGATRAVAKNATYYVRAYISNASQQDVFSTVMPITTCP